MKNNGVVHFEIYARDAEKLAKFYSSLFDWTIEVMPGMDYHYVKTVDTDAEGMPTQPGSINGGLIVRPAGFDDPGWINYVNVESLDPAVKRAQDLGATVMKPRAPVPGMGWFAMLVDPQGNSFALWERDEKAK
jgi:predicted enzyme related to lactoylglutathione lyase